MNASSAPSAFPSSILYTMIRVSSLDQSIAFYRDALGMRELRRETFTEGRFILVFMGYGDEGSAPTIELTWNWDDNDYSHGSGYGHVALGVADIYAACARLKDMGVNITRDAGPMTRRVASDLGSLASAAY
jgi:lactoylglutathione lyase